VKDSVNDNGSNPDRDDVSPTAIGYFVPLSSTADNSSINIVGLLQLVWARRWLFASIVIVMSAVSTVWSFWLPNIYRGEILLAPVTTDESPYAQMDGLGGLASLAGLPVTSGNNSNQNLATLTSRDFIWQFVEEKDLMPILFEDDWNDDDGMWIELDPAKQPGLWDAYRLFTEGMLTVVNDKKTGLVRVSIDWKDADRASQWANDLVIRLNEYLRSKAIERSEANLGYLNQELSTSQVVEMRETLYRLIENEQRAAMMANTQKEYAFNVIDPSASPDRKVRPKRAIILAFTIIFSAVFATIYIFFTEIGVKRLREEAK